MDDTVESIVFEDGNIRVDTKSGVYGNSPFTIQTGSCGEEGEYIQISEPFLSEYESMNQTFGPLGQVFVHEWAKYRYGVFEEFGYPGDAKYPMFYYKAQWTSNGQENVVTPNFCTNSDLTDYSMVDAVSGNGCRMDEETGLPDYNCIPVLGENVTVDSSIMAIPYLEGNDQFCDDSEDLYHRADIPTKHNDICDSRSTFNVILSHPDFSNFEAGNEIEDVKPTFRILGTKESSSFVMVLDVSGSMDDNCGPGTGDDCENRIDRMKQASMRWIQYDVKEGVPVGLVVFSGLDNVKEKLELKAMDESYRQLFIHEIERLKADGGTCMGDGLEKGIETLQNGNVPYGGVILFLTDGAFSCNNGKTLAEVIPSLKTQGVRVITIAFSDDADPDIIDLARETNGKAFFVPDATGPELINTAMQGSLTYQPSVPSDMIDIVIYEETFQGQTSFNLNFTIDELVGRNVTVQIDFSGNQKTNITIAEDVTEIFDRSSGTYQYIFADDLMPGIYTVQGEASAPISFASVKVTARSNSATVPIMTECWTTFGNNVVDFDESEDLKLAVIAKVVQGTNPVIGARVTAYIEREGSDAPIELTLYDEGSSPDNIANDGLYARYFTRFEPTNDDTRYSLKCQVEGTGNSQINQGFIDAREKAARALPSMPSPGSPLCCGSNALRDDSVLSPTGNFKRLSPGGVIEMKNAKQVSYPPGRVNNLRGGSMQSPDSFTLTFTSAGETLDYGTAKGIRVYFSQNDTLLQNNVENNVRYLTPDDVKNPSSLNATEAGTNVEIFVKRFLNGTTFEDSQQYFFRLMTIGESKSSWSNIAPVYILSTQPSSGNKTADNISMLVMISTYFLMKMYQY